MIKKTLLFLGLILSMLTVCAEENVLQTIEIVPVKDTYNIVLTTDKSVDVKKSVKDSNRITLDMKGIRASKTLNTIYNNAANVDTVMVENTSGGVSIFFQAENAQNSSITFDTAMSSLPAAAPAVSKQKVTLSSPVDSYAPIYREDMAQNKTSALFNRLTKKSEMMAPEIEDTTSEASDTLNKIFSYGLVGLLAFAVIRLFRRKDSNIKIGLSQSLNDREVDMYKNINNSFANDYHTSEKPFTTVNYGLNAYRKENQNPYEQEPVQFHNPRMQQYISPLLRNQMAQTAMQQQLVQPRQRVATMTAPVQTVKKHTTPVNTAPVNQGNPNINNMKFIESMTEIYEKSGRHDLAQGLKANLLKNNIKAS